MARYIDADIMQDFIVEQNDIDGWVVSQYNADWISSFIESQPTADVVEVKRGQWIEDEVCVYTCSECGFTFTSADDISEFKYCRCGAKMDGKE